MAFGLIRYLSTRHVKRTDKNSVRKKDSFKLSHKTGEYSCMVHLLDNTKLEIGLKKSSKLPELLNNICQHLELQESGYFGVCMDPPLGEEHLGQIWLTPESKITKQVKYDVDGVYHVNFRVKFYSSEPNNLHNDITKYLMYLQIKSDIMQGKLVCPVDTSVELAALSLQSEFGDWENEYTPFFVSGFRFDPHQNEGMEIAIFEKYKSLKGLSPAQSELAYLNKAMQLDMYGVELYKVLGKDGNCYSIGLTPKGVLIFEAEQKIGIFYWAKIINLMCKNKKLVFNVLSDEDAENVEEHTFVFRLRKSKHCRKLWNRAIEQHSFFRLLGPAELKAPKRNFLRLGSKFRFSGRTEYQTTILQHQAKKNTNIVRKPSKRYSRRESMRRYDNNLNMSTLNNQSVEYVSQIHEPSDALANTFPSYNVIRNDRQYYTSKTSTPNSNIPTSSDIDPVHEKRSKSCTSYDRSKISPNNFDSITFSRDQSSRHSYRRATDVSESTNMIDSENERTIDAVPVILTTQVKNSSQDSTNTTKVNGYTLITSVVDPNKSTEMYTMRNSALEPPKSLTANEFVLVTEI